MSTDTKAMGKPVDRVDGRLKVTGGALYAVDATAKNVAHAYVVRSTIGRGKVLDVDAAAAEKSPGVLAVLSYKNAPKLAPQQPEKRPVVDPQFGEALPPLQDAEVRFNGQPVALVVADTLEQARRAAALVKVSYREEKPATEFADAKPFPPSHAKNDQGKQRPTDYERGDPGKAFAAAEVSVAPTYTIPTEHHNPIETHATLAEWDGDKLTLHDKTQWVYNVRTQVAQAFGLKPEAVRVVSPFVGGAFGSALRTWWHVLLAAMAAKVVKRPVKLALTRQQMFTGPGFRPHTVQKVSLGATKAGKLTAIRHEGTAQTSVYEEYTESLLNATRMLYACPNVATTYRLAAMNVNTPTPMRAPGEASGVFALESAMDELAAALKLDPVELRLLNHADADPEKGLPWSSKSLKECYREGAKRFGWDKRKPEPASMRDGRILVGYGMASATYPYYRQPATALVRLLADGTAVVRTAASDMGPGTWTSMTQVAADALGLPVAKVKFELGDTAMPPSPVHGGSMTMASVGSAVQEAALLARAKVLEFASGDAKSPLHKATGDQISAEDGRLFVKDDPKRGATYAAILERAGKESVEVTHESKPGEQKKKFSMHAFGAHFVEVRVDPELGQVRVARVVTATAAGRIVNPKTTASQLIGGIVGGIGMALMEITQRDPRNGRVVNDNLADYHVPVNADVPALETILIDERDPHINPLGAKGVGEIALVGVAAAIGNAVYHATGKRVRELPISPEKFL